MNPFFKAYSGVEPTSENRRKNDFYPTPPIATYILHKYGNIPTKVIEPCAGKGNISVELVRCGHDVLSYDLYPQAKSLVEVKEQNAINIMPENGYNAIVTNPPYYQDLPNILANHFVENFDYTAFLVRLTFLEGQKRMKLFQQYPPSQILMFSDRLNFSEIDNDEAILYEDQAGGMIAYMWIIWDKNSNHENTKIDWVSIKSEYDEWYQHYLESGAL